MITQWGAASRWLMALAAVLLLLLPLPAAGAANNVARQEIVPTVTITAGASSHAEPDGPMRFTLHADPAPLVDLVVKIDSAQTGVVFTDVARLSLTQTVKAGETTHEFEFPVVNDPVVESQGVVTLTVSGSEGDYRIGDPAAAVTTLLDDDVPLTVSFDSTTLHIHEAGGTVVVPVTLRVHDGEMFGTYRNNDTVYGGTPFVVETRPLTASIDEDFAPNFGIYHPEPASFARDDAGDFVATINVEIEILDDTADEPGETFELSIESPLVEQLHTEDTVFPTERKTIVIADDDGVNNPPGFTIFLRSRTIFENTTVGSLIPNSQFAATDPDGHEVPIRLVGEDLPFEWDDEASQLKLAEALDFETRAEHQFAVAADDGEGESTETSVTITVLNVDEPGQVEFEPLAPTEGGMVEAILSDGDGSTNEMAWEWSTTADPDGIFDLIDGESEDHYMPTADDIGMYLRATVTYADGQGTGKNAEATTSTPVASRQETNPTVTVLWSEDSLTLSEDAGVVELPITVRVDGMQPPGTYESGGMTYEGRRFSVSTKSGTAVSPGDYDALSVNPVLPVGSFTLQDSGYYEANPTVSLTINDDDEAEPTESLSIALEMAPGESGITLPDEDLRVDIEDNEPPEITVSTPFDTVAETDRVVTVEVHAHRAPDEDIVVALDVSHPGHQLVRDSDLPLSVIIRAGSSVSTLNFAINNDATPEDEATATFTIVAPDGENGQQDDPLAYTIGETDSVTVNFVDDDEPVTMLFSTSPVVVEESVGTVDLPFTLRVDGQRPPGTYEFDDIRYEGPILGVISRHGTAMSPSDFEALSDAILLEVGSFTQQPSGSYEASGFVSLTVFDDDIVEDDESLTISISVDVESRGWVTVPTEPFTVTITDDDAESPVLPWPPPDFCPTYPDTPADMSTPLSVAVGNSVASDFCSKEDADWVQVFLVAGQAYRIEGTFTSPEGERLIYIGGMHDPDGEFITGSHSFDGNPRGTSNTAGYVNFRPTETGTHYIVAGDENWWDFQNATGPLPWQIEVHEIDLPPDDVPDVLQLVQEFNNYGQFVASFDGTINTHGDRDTFAIEVTNGHQYFVEMHDRNRSDIFNCIHRITPEAAPQNSSVSSTFGCQHRPGWRAYLWFTARHDGRYLITVGSENGTGDYLFEVRDTDAVPPGVWDTPLPPDDLADDTSTTGVIYVNDSWLSGTAVRSEIDLAGDDDWFGVELEAGHRYQIDIRGEGSEVGTLRNSFMWIHDASGKRVVSASNGGNTYPETRLIWTAPTSGTYFIQVSGSHFEIGSYDLSILDFADTTTIHRPS